MNTQAFIISYCERRRIYCIPRFIFLFLHVFVIDNESIVLQDNMNSMKMDKTAEGNVITDLQTKCHDER